MESVEKELIKKEFDTTKEKVSFVLEMDEESRNSDTRLFIKFLENYTSYRVINISEIKNAITIDSKDLFSSFDINEIREKILAKIEKELSKTPSLKYFPNSQTIHRARRKIQNEDENFLPTVQEIAERRNIRAELIREYFIEKKKEEQY